MKTCPRCHGGIRKNRVTEDCRRDGDAYGQEYYRCRDCPWFTVFEWDDASSPHYYELPALQEQARKQKETGITQIEGN